MSRVLTLLKLFRSQFDNWLLTGRTLVAFKSVKRDVVVTLSFRLGFPQPPTAFPHLRFSELRKTRKGLAFTHANERQGKPGSCPRLPQVVPRELHRPLHLSRRPVVGCVCAQAGSLWGSQVSSQSRIQWGIQEREKVTASPPGIRGPN